MPDLYAADRNIRFLEVANSYCWWSAQGFSFKTGHFWPV